MHTASLEVDEEGWKQSVQSLNARLILEPQRPATLKLRKVQFFPIPVHRTVEASLVPVARLRNLERLARSV
jgi:hypothetical protein